MLRASGQYQSVSGLGSTAEGQFVVRGRLYEFEEVDSGSIGGQVSMEFELMTESLARSYGRIPIPEMNRWTGKSISAVVAALDINLDRGLKEVAAGLGQYFSVALAKTY